MGSSNESDGRSLAAPVAGPVVWRGSARYQLLSLIGKGGMGVVYEALDQEGHRRVAIKTLLHFDAAALYLFKQEFRTLADVHHPNLVRLYELVAEEGHVFFSMELVRGTDFRTYVRRPGAEASPSVDSAATVRDAPLVRRPLPAEPGAPRPSTSAPRVSPADIDRLRPALRQLVEGVQALHVAGKLHRDIKPSNVLVTHEGRVVLLDFGVATELRRVVDKNLLEDGHVFGTACYMAPEQAVAETPRPASDWYSVGVMLYEALVGRPPFEGAVVDVLSAKHSRLPIVPSACVAGVPQDLENLALALLDPEHEGRPDGHEILRRLTTTRSTRPTATPVPAADAATTLVGREGHLRVLREAFDVARSGRAMTIRVRGKAGLGKSSLIHHFLDGLVERGEAAVLRGRAYERESLPYKAVDSVVDELSRYLMRLWDDEGSLALPRDMWALARVFPVLRRVPGVARLSDRPVTDLQQVRRRAFVALRELLGLLAKRQPLVVFVDDVQWGDGDSAALLREVMAPALRPPILLLLAQRDQEAETSSFLREMLTRWPSDAETRDLPVGPLETDHARRLVLTLLDSEGAAARNVADAIARESMGSPFLVEELTRSLAGQGLSTFAADATVAKLTLEQIVSERLALLPGDGRRLLEVVAVGGRPLPLSIVSDASGTASKGDEVVELLHTHRFVRSGLRDGREMIEMVHDRIRETIVALLPEEKVQAHHASLARALEAAPGADSEALAVHFFGAGDKERAARYAERAAEEATTKLAFEQAARLLRITLDAFPAAPPDALRLHTRLGDVLAGAGRATESAHAYLEAAEQATTVGRLDLERAAAEQLLAAGRIEEGGRVLHRVLARVGAPAPRTTLGLLLMLMACKAWLQVIGLRFRERRTGRDRPEERVRIDALHAAALGFATVDTILAACMQARQMLAALRAGTREQVLRAAAIYKIHLATQGGVEGRHERALDETIRRLAEGSTSEDVTFSVGTRGVALVLRGRWKESLGLVDAPAALLTGVRAGWQSHANLFAIYALVLMGELGEVRRRKARLLTEANERGDVFTSVQLRVSHPSILLLAADDPGKARNEVREAAAQWPQAKFLTQSWQIMRSEAEIWLYEGDGARAHERLKRDESALQKSFLLRVQFTRALTHFVRARAAIASLVVATDSRGPRSPAGPALLAEAARLAHKLERERMAWIAPLAAIVWAGVASARGDRATAIAQLRVATTRATAADMRLHAEAARLRLGLLVGGDEGAGLAREAREWMTGQDIRAPERMAAMLVPLGPVDKGTFGTTRVSLKAR